MSVTRKTGLHATQFLGDTSLLASQEFRYADASRIVVGVIVAASSV
jgi:hypothetical protein